MHLLPHHCYQPRLKLNKHSEQELACLAREELYARQSNMIPVLCLLYIDIVLTYILDKASLSCQGVLCHIAAT